MSWEFGLSVDLTGMCFVNNWMGLIFIYFNALHE